MTHGGTARIARLAPVLVILGVLLPGCVADGEVAPTASGTPHEIKPAPGRTIEATPPASVPGLDGHRIAVLVPDDSAASATLLSATRAVASANGAEVREFSADAAGEDPVGAALAQALDTRPDLIVGLGEGAVDVLGFESAQRLDQQFLVVGAQLPEPTDNVTAVTWVGATSRGSAAGSDGALDDASITADRGEDALEAGLASIQDGTTGVVLHLG
ncbi:BMP family ABC transporter substrate-binding protein [Isoptericola halotolerans]|uniref:BMP family ABC transporter substrate-binding protein n=1 Tax=Isoptericola halotolerans TaxID=300560 RepID=UPI0038906954